MLRLNNVGVKIKETVILRDVTLEVPEGALVGLVGRNGAGKTTTIKSIMGIVPVSSGDIILDSQRLLGVRDYERVKLGIGYMPEDRRLISTLTVEENIALPAWALGLKNADERLKFVYDLLPEVKAWAGQKAFELSGGQGKLVALGRALTVGTKLLLLDEPLEGVTGLLAIRLKETMEKLKEYGIRILVAESDPKWLESLADTMYTMERGEIVQG